MQRPIQLKCHERPLTVVKYNGDGDLLFTASKDNRCNVAVWWTTNGERVGTFNGHMGAVWQLDVDHTSERLVTASADSSVRLWRVATGEQLDMMEFRTPVRSVASSVIWRRRG